MSVRYSCALFKRAYVIMGVSLVVSNIGSRQIESAIPAMIVLGMLPVVFRPVFYTLEDITDTLAFFVTALTHRFSPMSVMLWCDVYDIGLTLLTLLVMAWMPGHLNTVLITYLVLMCPIPVFIDVADERYSGELSRNNRDEAARFNAFYYSALAFTGNVLASPIGNLLVGISIMSLLWVNLLLTLIAIAFRWLAKQQQIQSSLIVTAARSVSSMAPSVSKHHGESMEIMESTEENANDLPVRENEDELKDEGELPRGFFARLLLIKRYHHIVTSLEIGTPAFLPLVGFAVQLGSGYLILWIVLNYHGHQTGLMAAILVVTGLAATLSPHLSYRLMKLVKSHTQIHGGLLTVIVSNSVIFAAIILAGTEIHLWFLMLVITCYSVTIIAQTCIALAQMTERQDRFGALPYYSDLVGLGYSLSGLFSLLASWLGYLWLGYRHPLPVLMIGTLLLIIVLVMSFRRYVG